MAHFLETQIKSLKKLSISSGFDLNCLEVIYRIHELQKLKIFIHRDTPRWILDWNELALPQNNSIESLVFCNRFEEDNDKIMEAFVRPLPNIKHLEIVKLFNRMFNFLLTNSISLESIKCYYFRVSAARVLAGVTLPNLKILQADCHGFTEEELKRLRAEPTIRNKVHALLRDRLQYMRYALWSWEQVDFRWWQQKVQLILFVLNCYLKAS